MAKTWIVVADSKNARILEADTPQSPLNELTSMDNESGGSKEQDLISDRPGRSFDSQGTGRHAMEVKESAKKHENRKFADEILDYVEKAATDKRFDKLMLVAPPAFLGLLREAMSKNLEKLVSEEVNKDLVSMSEAEIHDHLPWPFNK